MGNFRSVRRFLGILILLVPVFSLGARDITVTILDGELEIPLEGAEIRSFDGNSYRGNEEGKVVLPVPEDRTVVVRGTYPGYTPGRLVIEPGKDEFTLELLLSGTLEARELVLEESSIGESEGRAGRSVALVEEEIRRTGEIGVIEDVMTSIKLLPGVGYSGLFNALPSIRGGQPGDLMASMDGFYIENPYHWGGGFSIFDPKMVQRAELSHGVFSTRYGHTISGLLDITVKKPSTQDMEFELGLSTSAANASLSFPIRGRGGVMLMGRLTYYDPVVWAFQGISRASNSALLKPVEAISTAPYIRSAALNANYRFTDTLEMGFTGFFGADGAAANYKDDGSTFWTRGYSSFEIVGSWVNYQGFGLAALTYNPRNDMVLKAGLGAGYARSEIDGFLAYSVEDIPVSDELLQRPPSLGTTFDFNDREEVYSSDSSANVQGRVDFDWDLGRGFLAALGFQELYSRLGT
ncbi:MAG: TonB-dependent receptor plug domain-containing protein, partial [Treponema sp.]|nr:TonB-dependent receptor plug domain-containing protein [Treponema sp.]